MTEDEIAKRVGEVMWAADAASQGAGMDLESVSPGRAVVALTVEPRHANGHGIAHGGYVFALADTAFAFACNSGNVRTVAQHNAITYIAPGAIGEVLRAEAVEVSRTGRSGIYDVTVTGEGGRTVALFRGHCREIGGQIVE